MGQTNRRASAWPSLAVLLAVSLSALQPAIADDTPEREQLAALAHRQVDEVRRHRVAEHADAAAQVEDVGALAVTLLDADGPIPKECHLVIEDGEIVGRVTSIARSETVGRVIGLAFLPSDREVGSRFQIRADGGVMVDAEVVPVPFYDPDGSRQKVSPREVAYQGERT